MANAFSKEEIVFFEQVLEGFDPNNITARQVSKFHPPSTQFERSALTVHRPVPYISVNKDGLNLNTDDFADTTQLSVPSTLNANRETPSDIKNVPFLMNAVELNDPLQRDRKAQSAVQALSAVVDRLIATEIANRGSLVVTSTSALTLYSQFAKCEEIMSIRDIPIMEPRTMIMNPVDYNGVASNLAARDVAPTGVSLTAFERSRIPPIATFDTFKANFQPTIQVNGAFATSSVVTVSGTQKYIPLATDANGNNVDNRTMELTINLASAGGTINAGDAFTIDGVFVVSLINKNVTQQLQTFRAVETKTFALNTPDTLEITPPIIVGGAGNSQAENEYANATLAVDTSAITFLNTVAAPSNIFFTNGAAEIVHGSLATMELDGSAGVATMRRATDSGIEILFAKSSNINDLGTEYRLTMWMAPNVLIPDMCGIILGLQT